MSWADPKQTPSESDLKEPKCILESGEEDLMCIPVPDAVCTVAPKIDKLFEGVLAARARARNLLAHAKRSVEIAIEDSEAAALKHLEEI